ncbi:MAG: LysR family transcriptional regulator [Oscillospiraceae bacterium]|nr:LysR family transcriptional regulator [Oscillospiraceae bacterium]
MDIREMKYIDMIAQTRSMTKAAQNLHISQPALHKSLRKVEGEYNTTFFYRKGHEVFPTDTGLVALEYARRTLDSLSEMQKKICEIQNLEAGSIAFGFPAVVGTLYLPQALIDFQKAYPGISLKIVEAGANELSALVENGTLDIAILVRPIAHQSLSEIPLLQDQVVAGVTREHIWRNRNHIAIEDFDGVTFNTFSPDFSVHTQLIDLFKEKDITPHIGFSGSNSEFLCQISTLSNGILVLPRPIIESICKDEMVLIPFTPAFRWELSLAFRKNAYLSTGSEALIRHLQEHFLHHI